MRRNDLALLLGVYVVPVAVAAVLLARAGLGILAVALVVIECVVAVSAYAARRQPARPSAPTRRPWLVPAAMAGAMGLMVVVAVLGSRAG